MWRALILSAVIVTVKVSPGVLLLLITDGQRMLSFYFFFFSFSFFAPVLARRREEFDAGGILAFMLARSLVHA